MWSVLGMVACYLASEELGLSAKLMNHLASLVRDAGFAVASLDVTETNLTAH
ncbi:MAG: hypothetical protein ACJAQS_000411 [Porticoccus sp.]|jgi:hypothetical protein